MDMNELAEVLRLHQLWLECDEGGVQVNLSYANLRDANLSYANLRDANLRDADLSGANLREANLRSAYLSGAHLIGANLREANLRNANLIGANLREANLRNANLRNAYLSGAHLIDADLYGANLSGANITEPICRMDFGGWSICVRTDKTSIGCQTHTNEEWLSYSPDDVDSFAIGAKEWWAKHQSTIKAAILDIQS